MIQSDQLVAHLRKYPFVLAPMAGITDCAFRSFMRPLGTPIVVTELISANGLEFGGEKTLQLMSFEEAQRPVGIQLFGETPESLARAARIVEEKGADFVDLNFGCPVKKVVKKGAGSAILKDLDQLRQVLRAVRAAVEIPVTIKIRTGWDHDSRNAELVTQIAYDEGIAWVAIHGRTRSMGYSGEADWDYIREIKAKSPVPVIGNGDVISPEQAVRRLKESGCDAVMIGRGCLKNPWIFQEALNLYYNESVSRQDRNFVQLLQVLRQHLDRHCDERGSLIQVRKLASWYSAGFPGSAQFRKSLFQTQSYEEAFQRSLEYFASINQGAREDTAHEPFLMSGHG